MKTHTAYIQVPCSKGLPKEKGDYITNVRSGVYFDGNEFFLSNMPIKVDWWLQKREDVIVMTKEELQSFLAGESKTNFGQ